MNRMFLILQGFFVACLVMLSLGAQAAATSAATGLSFSHHDWQLVIAVTLILIRSLFC